MLGTGIEVSAEDTNRPYSNLFQDSVNAKVLIKAQSCVNHPPSRTGSKILKARIAWWLSTCSFEDGQICAQTWLHHRSTA